MATMERPSFIRRAATIGADAFGAAAIILCIPIAILLIGLPVALGVQLVLWVAGRLQ